MKYAKRKFLLYSLGSNDKNYRYVNAEDTVLLKVKTDNGIHDAICYYDKNCDCFKDIFTDKPYYLESDEYILLRLTLNNPVEVAKKILNGK